MAGGFEHLKSTLQKIQVINKFNLIKYNNSTFRFGSIILNQNIDEDQAKSTAPLKNYKFEADKVWPEEETVSEIQEQPQTTSTPQKPEEQKTNILSIPLYKRLLEDNSFNSSLDEDLF